METKQTMVPTVTMGGDAAVEEIGKNHRGEDGQQGDGGSTDATSGEPGVANVGGRFSLTALRINTDYMAEAGVKKVITTIPVRRPPKTVFVRVSDDEEHFFETLVFEDKAAGEWYLVSRELWASLPGELIAVRFYLASTRDGNFFLLPVRLPGSDGRSNSWHESLQAAVAIAKRRWVRIVANTGIGGYDVLEASGKIPDPIWPDLTMQEIADLAFRGRCVDSLEHPIVRALLGKA